MGTFVSKKNGPLFLTTQEVEKFNVTFVLTDHNFEKFNGSMFLTVSEAG